MTSSAVPTGTFSGEQLVELLGLIQESDSVELKLTVPESDQRSTMIALDLDPLEAQLRQVFFFDTPELALDKQGIVVRARRIQGKGDDSVVKLRPVVPSELPAELRKAEGFRVEVDAMPGGFVCSASMKRVLSSPEVRGAAAGTVPIRKLFSKEQRAFFSEYAITGADLDGLSVLGPIFVLKLTFTPPELGYRLAAELWVYPDGSRVLELSTRVGTHDAFQRVAELRAYLHARGVEIGGEQETKTRKALEYFADVLKGAGT